MEYYTDELFKKYCHCEGRMVWNNILCRVDRTKKSFVLSAKIDKTEVARLVNCYRDIINIGFDNDESFLYWKTSEGEDCKIIHFREPGGLFRLSVKAKKVNQNNIELFWGGGKIALPQRLVFEFCTPFETD